MEFKDEFKRQYKNLVLHGKVMPLDIIDIPADEELCWYEQTIERRFSDYNGHTNIKFYVLFALEGILKGLKDNTFKLKLMVNSVDDLKVKEINTFFRGESRKGDILHIGCWQAKNEENMMFCQIKKEKHILVTLKVELHSDIAIVSNSRM